MLPKFVDPERHHNLIEQLPPSVPGTGCGWAYSVALEVVCSLLPGRLAASNQIETLEKIEEMSRVAGCLARRSRTVVELR